MRHVLASTLFLLAAAAAQAADTPAALRDPWVPPAVRAQAASAPAQAPTRGAALSAQVERKLRAAFEAADVQRTGRITREQARAAGLGHVDRAFEQIDTGRTGTVSFDEIRRYLRSRGARSL